MTGRLLFAEGPPVAFDVTVGPGELVTLDLADLAAKVNRGR